MATFRRDLTKGATYFFTVTSYRRQPFLTKPEVIATLREAIAEVKQSHPFDIVAWAVLPDHMHTVWALPENDADYGLRWGLIKRFVSRDACQTISVTKAKSQIKRNESGFWQRRFWEHRIRNDADLQRHVDYTHYNPVKHELVERVVDWPHSTFHRFVERGWLNQDWAGSASEGEFGE
jgi:putative transposase